MQVFSMPWHWTAASGLTLSQWRSCHCEPRRGVAIQRFAPCLELDCRVASLLAVTVEV